MAFLGLSLADMGTWVNQLNSWSLGYIGQAACKDQFNHIPPSLVIRHMKEGAAWLKAHHRWRATTLGLSIRKENRQLDCAGSANKGAPSGTNPTNPTQAYPTRPHCVGNDCLSLGGGGGPRWVPRANLIFSKAKKWVKNFRWTDWVSGLRATNNPLPLPPTPSYKHSLPPTRFRLKQSRCRCGRDAQGQEHHSRAEAQPSHCY